MTQVRRATIEDVSAILPLVSNYWDFEGLSEFDPPRVSLALNRLLSDASLGAGWIAVDDEQVVGYLLAVYVFSLEHFGLTAEIDELFTLPRMRQTGTASKLLRIAENAFSQCGCTNVSLQLSRDNDIARSFYRRHGYAERARFELLEKAL